MIELQPPFRTAVPGDADAMAELVNMAGEGLPLYLWERMAAPGESAWDVGRSRARRKSGGFSYRNTIVQEAEAKIIGCLIGYPLPDEPEPANYDDMPAMFVPLQELENMVPGTWYVNVLAVYPECRGHGHGLKLLSIADQMAKQEGRGLSIIVSDANTGARRLYQKHGYREVAQRPMVKEEWENSGQNWVLLVKGHIAVTRL